MIRAFIAISVSGSVASRLLHLQQTLPCARPVPTENFHLTLAFLGEQSEDVLEELHFVLDSLAESETEVVPTTLNTFGGKRGPSVLVLQVDPTPQLSALRKAVRGAASRAGLVLPRERFRPHVTLARFRSNLRPEDHSRIARYLERNAAPGVSSFTAKTVMLYRSTLRPDGAVHDPMATYRLRAPVIQATALDPSQ